ncbi:MAG: polysaccharide deacetylase family protein [Gemmatimonadaceae bacterium]
MTTQPAMAPHDLIDKTFTWRGEDHFILMYHHVGSLQQLGVLAPFVVSPAAFRSQLDSIEARGLKVETLREVFRGRRTRDRSRSRSRVVITFDDCPRGLLEFAVPELERRGWKATFFAVAGKVGGYNDWEASTNAPRVPLMRWEDLRELAALGHEIGAHGFSHVSLRRCTPQQARFEMSRARETLEQGAGIPVRTFAYPFGEAPDGYRRLCGDTGYESSCSIFSMSARVLGDRFDIRRILVTERDTGLRMRMKLSHLYLRARGLVVDRRILLANGVRSRLDLPAGAESDRSMER